MPNGFGRGNNAGRGFGRGSGFGFRGSSPPWPYVGIGRGGLPRGAYYTGGAAPAGQAYPQPDMYNAGAPFAPQATPEQELDFLSSQAKTINQQLQDIETRIRNLESQK